MALHEPAMMKTFGNKVCLVLQELLRKGADIHRNPRLGSTPESCIQAVLYWTQLKPCTCIEELRSHHTQPYNGRKFVLAGNRAIGLLQPKQIWTLVKSQMIDITEIDCLGESTMSYVLMLTRKNNCLENVRLLLELGCTVRNHKQIVQALLRTGAGENNNCCFPSLGPYADNDWIFPSNRYWKYSQILSLLAAAGLNPESVDEVEDFISEGYDEDSDQVLTREVISGRRRYVDPCEYDMVNVKQSPPSLIQFCRATIRKHLIQVNNRSNLLVTIPEIPLPRSIHNYLLYKSFWHHIISKQFT